MQFPPSADQAWQFWANNELTQSATYPSMFAKVHKNQLADIGATLRTSEDCTWQVPTIESRKNDLDLLNAERVTWNHQGLTPKRIHQNELVFMAEKGIRQLGEPRIGIFANRQRSQPFHLEVNNWTHILKLLYVVAIQKNTYKEFIEIIKKPASSQGCNLKYIGEAIDKHYVNESTRFKTLTIRLIGAQGISLARYSVRVVDQLKDASDDANQQLLLLALSKICEYLRKIGAIMNNVTSTSATIEELSDSCKLYFNMFSLFFNSYCNSTVWTIGYVVPYHASLLFEHYKIGYGILSMQGKESKHSAIKQELKSCSNRSCSEGDKGKWHTLARSSYIRHFYLPYHFPLDNYTPHFDSRYPLVDEVTCGCFRVIAVNEDVCSQCLAAMELVNNAKNGYLSDKIIRIMKPQECLHCQSRFSDIFILENHMKVH